MMKKVITIFGILGLLIGCLLPVFSILWELSEIRGACQKCPVNFWENTTSSDITTIVFAGIIGMSIGVLIGFIVYKAIQKLFLTKSTSY